MVIFPYYNHDAKNDKTAEPPFADAQREFQREAGFPGWQRYRVLAAQSVTYFADILNGVSYFTDAQDRPAIR